MLPIIEVPETIALGMKNYRNVFCEGFDYVSRYVTGLIISPNKTLQGIYDLQVWEDGKPSRRAMHGFRVWLGFNGTDETEYLCHHLMKDAR